jgi:UDPglucose 6-dehydrogenase
VPGVDVEDVLGIIHSDRRLTPAVDGKAVRPEILSYLKAGCGFGGSCLPKDISALIAASRGRGEELPLLEAVRAVNEAQPVRVVESAARALGGLDGRTVAVLGVAFKGGTDDLRSSPGLRIVEELLARGAKVAVYDPLVSPRSLDEHQQSGQLSTADDVAAALEAAEACIITTNAPEFTGLGALLAEGNYGDTVIIDGRRILAPNEIGDAAYLAVGRAAERSSPPLPR